MLATRARALHPQHIVAAVVALVPLIFWPSTRSLIPVWNAEHYGTYAHGWLVLAVCAWLLLRERDNLAQARRAPVPAAQVAVIASTLTWVIGYSRGYEVVHQAALPLIMLSAIWAVLGRSALLICLVPIGYVYFAIPVWSQFDGALVALCVAIEHGLLWVSGIPVEVSGVLMRIPEGTFEIDTGCDGVYFIIVATAMAALLGQLNGDSWRSRLKMIALGAGVAILANTVRIHTLFVLGHVTHMQHPIVRVSAYHKAFGWIVFAPAMVTYFAFTAWRGAGRGRHPVPRTSIC